MSFLGSAIKVSLVIVIFAIGMRYYQKHSAEIVIKEIEEWAEKNKIVVDRSNTKILREFQIPYDEAEWKKLVNKLENTKYFSIVDEKYVKRHEFGFDPDYSKVLVDYWKSKFDWKKQVNQLNRYKQYQIDLNDTTIHFVRTQIRPDSVDKNAESIKIILIDGWPGSFFGFYKMLDYLTEKRNENKLVLDIIVPSIPGYGYSTPLRRPIDTSDTAFLLDGIMRYLHGEDVKYFTHGEDWGAMTSNNLAQLFPNRVKGIHLSMPTSSKDFESIFYLIVSQFFPSLVFTEEEIALNISAKTSLGSRLKVILKEAGYMHLQATKPDTVGHALTDSPVGLMAYILEKYSVWTFDFDEKVAGSKDGSLESLYSKDELLSIITFYWMTNSITSSIRFYKNFFAQGYPKSLLMDAKVNAKVACGVQTFRNEIIIEPAALLKLRYLNLKKITHEPEGGHFAAFQNPVKTADDLLDFIRIVNKE